MHSAKNMVGELRANYSVGLIKRYFRLSKHQKPGRIKRAALGMMLALELRAGVFAYG